ncbi:unnamed protein product [Paramecium pentaurelia]|uniref:Uncharacterized protein n=1 Tax=Paramecium pentaurelia TaxID=43138 RepID=A0A8S1S0N3_9CILI|nr:unnamed protein product [Paramecium pentaurelia]
MDKPPQQEEKHLFKIVLIGDSSVGKSNILSRFTKRQFNFDSQPTIGVEFATRSLTENGKIIQAQIWDTCGQERYKSITSAYYRGAVGAMLIYDITKQKTFENIEKWIQELKEYAETNVVAMLIGNKADLKAQRKVPSDKAAQFAENHTMAFMEVSAFDGTNVDLAFSRLINEIYQLINKQSLAENQDQSLQQQMQSRNNMQIQQSQCNQSSDTCCK